jgi:hypothetical protein
MTLWKTDYDKIRHLQSELDKTRKENKLLRREIDLCQEKTMKQFQK